MRLQLNISPGRSCLMIFWRLARL